MLREGMSQDDEAVYAGTQSGHVYALRHGEAVEALPAADPLGRSGARVAQWRSCSCPACSPPRRAAEQFDVDAATVGDALRRCPSATSSWTRAARYGRSSTSSSTGLHGPRLEAGGGRGLRSGSSPRRRRRALADLALPDGGRDAGDLAVGDHRLDLVDLATSSCGTSGSPCPARRRPPEPEGRVAAALPAAVLDRLDRQEDGGIDALLRAREDVVAEERLVGVDADPEPCLARPRSARRGRSRRRPGRSRSSRARSGSAPAPCTSPGRPSPASSRGSA